MASPGIGSGWRIAVRARREAVPIGNFMDRIMGFFGIPEEEDLEEVEEAESGQPRGRGETKSFPSTPRNRSASFCPSRVPTRRLRKSPTISKSHRPVVINLQRVRREQAIRIIDFLSGTVYALGGSNPQTGKPTSSCALRPMWTYKEPSPTCCLKTRKIC